MDVPNLSMFPSMRTTLEKYLDNEKVLISSNHNVIEWAPLSLLARRSSKIPFKHLQRLRPSRWRFDSTQFSFWRFLQTREFVFTEELRLTGELFHCTSVRHVSKITFDEPKNGIFDIADWCGNFTQKHIGYQNFSTLAKMFPSLIQFRNQSREWSPSTLIVRAKSHRSRRLGLPWLQDDRSWGLQPLLSNTSKVFAK